VRPTPGAPAPPHLAQIDGEPWPQPIPGGRGEAPLVVEVQHAGVSKLLHNHASLRASVPLGHLLSLQLRRQDSAQLKQGQLKGQPPQAPQQQEQQREQQQARQQARRQQQGQQQQGQQQGQQQQGQQEEGRAQ
jgi:hypothetical protein